MTTTTTALPGVEHCPGHLQWSAFGAAYMDTVCASALDWAESAYEPVAVLCDADDDFRPKDIPCPFCNPEGFIEYRWGAPEEHVLLWASDETPVERGTGVHFHDGEALWWTATHPKRGEEQVLFRAHDQEADDA